MNNLTPTTQEIASEQPDGYCSNCGHKMSIEVNDFRPVLPRWSVTYTCRNPRCEVYTQTLSIEEWQKQTRLDMYKVGAVVRFDVHSGDPLAEVKAA